jgi:hypothetical protein
MDVDKKKEFTGDDKKRFLSSPVNSSALISG